MSTVKPDAPEAPSAAAITEEFQTKTATLRGVTYVFKELSIGEYEKLMKVAEGPDKRVDSVSLLRLMVLKSMQSPKLNAEALTQLPMPVLRKINDIVNEMHYAELESDEEKAERQAEEAKSDPGE